MARRTLACVLLLVSCPSLRSERWSRQISAASDYSDWVPLPGPGPVERLPPIKRQAVAEPRILSEPVFPGFVRPTGFSQDFNRNYFGQASNRQLYLQSVPAVPSAPQNYLTDQGFTQGSQGFLQNPPNQFGQGIRFGLSQPNFPLTQGFVGPQFTFDTNPNKLRPSVVSNPIRFENPKQPLSPQAKPFVSLPPKIDPPKFIDGYRAENASDFGMKSKKPLSLQKLKYEIPRTEMVPPPNKAKSEREEVQLLYVPLESLNRGSFNFRPVASSHLLNTNNEQYNQSPPRPAPAKQSFAAEYQRPTSKLESFGTEQDFFTNFNYFNNNNKNALDQVKYSTVSSPFPTLAPTTPKPKRLKPHQPPLAIFTSQEAKRGSQLKVGDVLASLKNAPSIAVLDTVNPNTAPKVFIGPSNLVPPENYVKFELPYLSNIEHSDKKLRQLPFFVAPLSYNTPQGFAKIPFPSPHVGSVVINSQIGQTQPPITPSTIATPAASVIPNSYSTPPPRKPESKLESKPLSQKPTYSYFSTTAPKTNPPSNYQSNYYSIEPQSVSTLRPPKEPQSSLANSPRQPPQQRQPPRQPQHSQTAPRQPGSYFLRDQERYNPAHGNIQEYKPQEPVKAFNVAKPETSSAKPTTTTTAKASTYPNQLLETHNPYSINQAFHFSTPLDYHSLFDEGYATPSSPPSPPSISTPSSTISPSTKTSSVVTEENYQAPNYIQNYSPEIHYQDEYHSQRNPVYNEYTTKPQLSSENSPSVSTVNDNSHSVSNFPENQYNTQSASKVPENEASKETQTPDNIDVTNRDQFKQSEEATRSPYYQYETTHYETAKEEQQSSTLTTTSSTTTTRRSPVRNRGRPRYTTTPRSDASDTTSRTVTRRPLRERKPATRPRYESNRATERITSTSQADNDSTTKFSRGRVRSRVPSYKNSEKATEDEEPSGRGRTQYKPSASDDFYGKSNNGRYKNKEGDLAYQRDVLHQNYPVTIQERTSTKDIDAITEPSPRISSTRNLEAITEVYDTENAYSYDRASISHQKPNLSSKEETYDAQTEASYIPSYSPSQDEDYQYRSSVSPVETESAYVETSRGDDDVYARQTTAAPKLETVSFVTEPASVASIITEQSPASYSISNENSKIEDTSTTPEQETKIDGQENTDSEEPDQNIVQTTPSYNRVRVRPGVIRQYHHASSTESSKIKTDRKRPAQAVTYRPAFNQRRTTMRIEEIEHDLKTKQVHVRPEFKEINRHPVYRPESTTQPPATTTTSQDTTKRTVFRRRRPSYTTTTTEGSAEKTSKKPTFEVKSRFRGRRPVDRTTEKTDTDATTTTRSILHSRYSNRPKLSERFNKKPQEEDQDDQESNYSFNRPKYVEPEGDLWSPKISTDTFKPYNPNDIADDKKVATTERRSDYGFEEEIITARNEYDDILLTVTPATNNKGAKKISDISPTLDALVEQTKTTKGDPESMSTFETMLEEVMKSLEEQDENEYSSNVMKHKGGEIGEIPPERVITSDDNERKTTVTELEHVEDITTPEPVAADDNTHEDEKSDKGRRRGFWKKVKVRPVTEAFETAESQYYTNTVNRLGNTITLSKTVHDKNGQYEKSGKSDTSKITVTTYKPNFQTFMKDIINVNDDDSALDEIMPVFDIPKIGKTIENNTEIGKDKDINNTETKIEIKAEAKPEPTNENIKPTEANLEKETQTEHYLRDVDLGTGSPDSTLMDVMYRSTPTEPTLSTSQAPSTESDQDDRNDGFSFMDYFFGYTSNGSDKDEDSDKTEPIQNQNDDEEPFVRNRDQTVTEKYESKQKLQTTESSYIPEEFTVANEEEKVVIKKYESYSDDEQLDSTDKTKDGDKGVTDTTHKRAELDSVTPSSFMNPNNVMSTSMSTEVSHETEICFRGKCIKTSKDIL